MTEHLPECWATHENDPPAWCICDELRACEDRVTAAAVQRGYDLGRTDGILLGEENANRNSVIVHEGAAERRGYVKGQRDALAAAVQRVAVLPWTSETWLVHDERVAIIAAIWGDSDD